MPSQVWGAGLALALAIATPAGAGASPEVPRPVDVTGATRIEYDAKTEKYVFRGPRVVVVRGEQRLEAPVVLYDAAARRAVLPEGGTVSTPTMEMMADQMTADLGTQHFLAEGTVTARFLDQGVWMTLRAGRLEADDRPEVQRVEAAGDVVVVRDDQQLRADRIIYDRRTQQGTADGHADLRRGTDHLQADHVAADLAAREAEAIGHVVLDRESEGLRGSADRATYSERTRTAVLSGHAVLARKQDVLTAGQITVHLDRHVAVAEGQARLVAFPEETQP